MNLKNIKNIFKSDEKKASTTGSMLVQFGNHVPHFTPRQYDRLSDEGYRKNIIVYRCIKLISQNASAVPFIVYQGSGADKKELSEHPLIDLLKRPNPNQGGMEFFESLYAHYLIAGNAYIEAVGPEDKAPLELWGLRPDRMQIIPGRGGMVEAYRYTVNGKSIDFAADSISGDSAILHIKSFHPLDDWYGMSPLEAAAFSIDQHNDAAKWNASLLQTSGRPSGAIVYKPVDSNASDVMTDEQRNNLKTEIETFFSGAKNAGRPLVLEGGLEWQEMALSPKEMDWISGKDVSAREIALAFNIPAQLIGISGSLTFSNFEQARLAMFDDAILPLLEHVKIELNNWLSVKYGDDISIDYDIDSIEALAPRRKEHWDKINSASFLTINEKRQMLGIAPLEDTTVIEEE